MQARCPVCRATCDVPGPNLPGERLKMGCLKCGTFFDTDECQIEPDQSDVDALFETPDAPLFDSPFSTGKTAPNPLEGPLPPLLTGQTFDPDRPLPIPTRTPAAPKPLPIDDGWLKGAADSIPNRAQTPAAVGRPDPPPNRPRGIDPAPVGVPDRPKTSRLGCWIALGVVGVLFVGCAGTWYFAKQWFEYAMETAIATVEVEGEAFVEDLEAELEDVAPVSNDPVKKGHYMERYEERGGRRVRILSPADQAPRTGRTDAPSPQTRKKAPKRARKTVPKPAPRFKMRRAEGGHYASADTAGKVVVLNFFATWCAPCKREVPDFVRFHKGTLDNSKVEVYGVVMESGLPDKAIAGSRKMGVSYPLLLGSKSDQHSFRITGFPTTVVIDPQGRITARGVGAVNEKWLIQKVNDAWN